MEGKKKVIYRYEMPVREFLKKLGFFNVGDKIELLTTNWVSENKEMTQTIIIEVLSNE